MANTHVPASAGGMPSIMLTRRAALSTFTKGAAAGALTIATTGAAHAASADLLDLIHVHRTTVDAYARAAADLDEAELAFEQEYETNPIRLKGNLAGWIDPIEDTHTSVVKHYERERVVFVGERVRHLYPEAHKLIADRIGQMEAEDLVLFETAHKMLAERRTASGLDDLVKREAAADLAESEAYKAFTAFAPQTMADVAIKVSYALELVQAGGESRIHLEDLASSLSGLGAA